MVMAMNVFMGVTMTARVIVHMRLGIAVASAKQHSYRSSTGARCDDSFACDDGLSP